MIEVLLAVALWAPNYHYNKSLTNRQIRAKAYQIVQHLKRQDPRILRSVMYQMRWVPKIDYKRERRKRQRELDTFDQWHLDFLLNEAGIPNPRKKRRK